MVRRSRLEIYFDVLETIDRGYSKPTQIMYKTNLSWSSLQEIFKTLINGSFINEEQKKKTKRYYITDKGKRAIYYHMKSIDGLVKPKMISARLH
jgi:predicted transcriptional regulator